MNEDSSEDNVEGICGAMLVFGKLVGSGAKVVVCKDAELDSEETSDFDRLSAGELL